VAVTRPLGHVVTAVHMTWGALNELLTFNGYRLLARRTEHPLLAELLRRIAAQEARHYAFYLLQAEYRLAESRLARRIVPALVGRTWTPVGVGDDYKAPEEFDDVLGYLAGGPDGERTMRAMDEAIARLPGFAGQKAYASLSLTSPTMVPAGSATCANVTMSGISVTGTTTLPPAASTLASAASRSSVST
jgi:hypothetical protein